jgi:hypothetical protein
MRDSSPAPTETGLAERLLYIMGTARSGSTALQILLSQAEDAFGAGELSYVAEDLFLRPKTCSCGEASCSIWTDVRDRIGWTLPVAKDVAAVFRQTDGHRAAWSRRRDLTAYGLCNRQVLHAIRERTGARVIIDGSKYAARALALQQVLPIRVICLTRSFQGLRRAWSRQVDPVEQPPKSLAAVLAYCGYVHPALAHASQQLGEVLPVTYEALAADPAGVLATIGAFAELDLGPAIDGLRRQASLPVGHLLRGNRLRRAGWFRWAPTLP